MQQATRPPTADGRARPLAEKPWRWHSAAVAEDDDLLTEQRRLDAAERDLAEREAAALRGGAPAQELAALAAERDVLADRRDDLATRREAWAASRDERALHRDVRASERDRAVRRRTDDADPGFPQRWLSAVDRDAAVGDRADALADRRRAELDREHAAQMRQQAASTPVLRPTKPGRTRRMRRRRSPVCSRPCRAASSLVRRRGS